jgi:hypothetical protein
VPLYEIADSGLTRHEPAAFADLGLYERADLQRIVRDDIGVLGNDLLVIAEEFGEWEDAHRRVDLLAVDKAGCLVVIELKRDDGAHMDLQALRYAAIASLMEPLAGIRFGVIPGSGVVTAEARLTVVLTGQPHDSSLVGPERLAEGAACAQTELCSTG